MRNILLLGVGAFGLVSCNLQQVEPPPGGFIEVIPTVDMLSRCETVSWSETALRWSADNQLAPGYSLWQYANGKWVQAPASALSGKNIVMGQATYRVVNNDVQFTVLNSTFTCTKTGETLKATYTFPAHSVTAVIVLEILNSQPVGRWDIVRPLD